MVESQKPVTAPSRDELKANLQREIGIALGIKADQKMKRGLVNALLAPILNRICDWGVEYDRLIREGGISEASKAMTPFFFKEVRSRGQDSIPSEGPLIIAANHPTGLESFPLAGFSRRPDLIAVSSPIFFFEQLPALRPHMIITSPDSTQRTNTLRESLRHLAAGGALLIYPTGLLDPDPGFFSNARDKLAVWSRSLSLFIKQVPETKIVPAIVSDVFNPRFLFTKLTQKQFYRIERQKMSTFLQGLSVFAFKGPRFNADISFGEAISFDPEAARDSENAQASIIKAATCLLEEHISHFPPTTQALWPEYADRERF